MYGADMRLQCALVFLVCAGCADGNALRNGTRGSPSATADAALDARVVDRGPRDAAVGDARPSPVDAAPSADAAPSDMAAIDMAPGPNCVPETCNDLDDDCDGSIDEGVADCCIPGTRRDCGLDVGQCTLGDQFCTVDLVWSPCSADPPTVEVCDGLNDEDCDGQVDEQVANACGDCGPAPAEACNARDDDCDGLTDEGTLNACGECGRVPREVCNGADDDCDGAIDEGVLNACGQCGAAPTEICNGVDDDCDRRIDEDACYAFVLDDADGVWRAPPGLNASPLMTGRQISAAFATVRGGDMLWMTAGNGLHGYNIERDRWVGNAIPDPFDMRRVDTAYTIPAWWIDGPDTIEAAVTVTEGINYKIFGFDPVARRFTFIRSGTSIESWAEDPAAPQSFPLQAAILDLFDNDDYWPGDVQATCGRGAPGPIAAVLTDGRLFTGDAGTCALFMDERAVGTWAGFRLPSAPPAENIVAWAYVNRPDRTGMHIIILDRPEDGR